MARFFMAQGSDMPKQLPTLKQRKDFLAMNRAPKWVTPGFILQYAANGSDKPVVGYTVSKKVGNAVVRNTMKRRFRALAAEGLNGEDARFVLIGRPGAMAVPFAQLKRDLAWALRRVKAKAGKA